MCHLVNLALPHKRSQPPPSCSSPPPCCWPPPVVEHLKLTVTTQPCRKLWLASLQSWKKPLKIKTSLAKTHPVINSFHFKFAAHYSFPKPTSNFFSPLRFLKGGAPTTISLLGSSSSSSIMSGSQNRSGVKGGLKRPSAWSSCSSSPQLDWCQNLHRGVPGSNLHRACSQNP